MRPSISILAPAKLNLSLAVGPPHSGMHPICSWMAPVSLYDELTLTALEPGYFSRYAILWAPGARRTRDIDWSITKDLAVRAHLLLERTLGRALPVQMKLEKRIPVGGGMGGGSSDAAAMLRGCNDLFQLGLSADDLRTLAARIGSDVPFFIDPSPAIVSGIGDRIEPLASPRNLSAVVILPELESTTPAAYRHFDELNTDVEAVAARFAAAADALRETSASSEVSATSLINHLEEAVFALHPPLGALRRQLHELLDLPVHLTGSGSTLFVLAPNAAYAELLAERIEQVLEIPALPVSLHTPL